MGVQTFLRIVAGGLKPAFWVCGDWGLIASFLIPTELVARDEGGMSC